MDVLGVSRPPRDRRQEMDAARLVNPYDERMCPTNKGGVFIEDYLEGNLMAGLSKVNIQD